MDSPHEVDVEGLEAVAGGGDEVEAGVDEGVSHLNVRMP